MSFRNGQYEGHGYDLWMTPPEILEPLVEEFGELYDPCPADWDGQIDGLTIPWPTDRVCFVNPPYSEIKSWAEKCESESKRGCTILFLIPSRTDTRYFHDYIYGKAELRFFKGRIKFVDGRDPEAKRAGAPFPSMLCIWRGV